jgi:hypothetical protein
MTTNSETFCNVCEARRLEKLYDTKANGIRHSTILHLIQERGLNGTIVQLESWRMKPVVNS